jgi:hypothetical protein
MIEFLLLFKWFFYGFVTGLLTIPVYKFLTKFAEEAKIAKQQWNNPYRRDTDEHAS